MRSASDWNTTHFPLFDTLPKVYDEIVDSFHRVYGNRIGPGRACRSACDLAPGSAATVMAIRLPLPTARARRSLLRTRLRPITILAVHIPVRRLRVSVSQIPASASLKGRLDAYERSITETAGELQRTSTTELYRRVLLLLSVRVQAARRSGQERRPRTSPLPSWSTIWN